MPQITVKSAKSADIRTFGGVTNENDGAGAVLRVYKDGSNNIYRSLVKFDLSNQIPTNAIVTGVSITLKAEGTQSGTLTISAYNVLRDWGEGTKTLSAAASGECNWDAAKASVDNWGTAGCSNTSTDRSNTAEDSKVVSSAADWVMTPSIATVQGWVSNPATNFGLLIKSNEPAGTNYIYFHSDDAAAANQPSITVTYTVPRTTTTSRSAAGQRHLARSFVSCLNFNAGSDRIDLATAASLNITGAITQSAWFKSKSTGIAYIVVGYQTSGGFPGYGMRVNNGNPQYFSGAAGAWVGSSGSLKINDGQWHHVACFISSTTVSFYVDGVLHGTGASQLPNSWSGVRILGKDNGTGVVQKLDDIRIYNTNLTGADITNMFYGVEPPTTNLVGWWKLDEGSGASAIDSSPIGTNTGTITGATYSTDVFMLARSAAGARTAV